MGQTPKAFVALHRRAIGLAAEREHFGQKGSHTAAMRLAVSPTRMLATS